MVAVDGRLEPEAGQSLLAALEPLARPAPPMRVVGASVGPMPWPSWPAGPWRGAAASDRRGPAPADRHRGPGQPAGPHPAGRGGRLGGTIGPGGGRRLACDGALTRILVTRQPTSPGPGGPAGLTDQLQTAAALLPPVLGGAPTQPLEVGPDHPGRPARPTPRLAVRDGGCVFPCCDRPLAWCEAHHLWHWRHGGPTDLD